MFDLLVFRYQKFRKDMKKILNHIKNKSVFTRIFLATLSVCAIIITVFAIITYSILERGLNSGIERMLNNSAALIADTISAGVAPTSLDSALRESAKTLGIRTTVVDSDGKVIIDSSADSDSMSNHIGRSEIRSALDGKKSFVARYSQTIGKKMLYAALPALKNSSGGYKYCVRQSVPLADIAKISELFAAEIMTISIAAVILAALFSWRIARSIALPLVKLTDVAYTYAGGDLEAPVPHSKIPEISQLGDSLSEMAATLRKRINSLNKRTCELGEIFEHMSEAVFICSSDGEIRRLNKSCNALFPNAVQHSAAASSFRNSSILDAIDETFAAKKTIYREIELGDDKVYALVGSPLPYQAKKERALFVLRDVSDSKRAERMRREFAAGASHELKTPITAVRMSAETICDLDDISQIKHFVGIILRESERMSNLVDDMLLLSRIEFTEKNVRENFSLFPVSAAISEAVSVHESELSAKNDNIQVDCPGALEMRGDFCLIQMAVSNLISNAVKYGGDSCSIRIAARRKFDDIEISVSDTGPGISAANLPRVFERFFRADKGRSRALGGTGLGLAIVKHIAILHGGGVAVSSTPGSGSIFTITFKA